MKKKRKGRLRSQPPIYVKKQSDPPPSSQRQSHPWWNRVKVAHMARMRGYKETTCCCCCSKAGAQWDCMYGFCMHAWLKYACHLSFWRWFISRGRAPIFLVLSIRSILDWPFCYSCLSFGKGSNLRRLSVVVYPTPVISSL